MKRGRDLRFLWVEKIRAEVAPVETVAFVSTTLNVWLEVVAEQVGTAGRGR